MSPGPPPIPIPVATLSYQPPPREIRPGVMTAVGIMSIVLGSLSFLSSAGGILSSAGLLIMSRISSTFPITPSGPVPIRAANVVTEDGMIVSPAGSSDAMSPVQRRIAIDGLVRARSIRGLRQEYLDLLFQNSGKKIFPFVTDTTDPQDVADRVTSAQSATATTDVYVLETGSIRISDRGAIFRPADNGPVVEAKVSSSPTTVPTLPPVVFPFRVNARVAIASIIENLVGLLVAIMLLVAGILLMRNSPKFWRPHWWFVWLKIPLIIVATIADWFVSASMLQSAASTPGAAILPSSFGAMMIIPAILKAMFVMAYPISLIFILNSQTARTYYGQLRQIMVR